jgi:hypothetical protein
MRKERIDNPRYPHHITIVRKVYDDWLSSQSSTSSDGDGDIIIYDGVGRSYTDTTTTGDAKVDSNKRKASIPVRFDKWPSPDNKHGQLVPMSGDILTVTKGNITEYWEVKDFEPDNDRSVVYGEHNRNTDEEI